MDKITLTKSLAAVASVLLLATSCQRTNDLGPVTQDAFRGLYSPAATVVRIRHDLHEEGVEARNDSLTYYDNWIWNTYHRRLDIVEFDREQNYLTEPTQDFYYYNSNGRLDSICHRVGGVSKRTFHFTYSDGLLSQINFLFGEENRNYTTDFLYHNGQQYPYAIVFTHPLQNWMIDNYGTDTLVQRWTLEWSNGNLIRATADSMAWYCTGLSKIEYAYDNHPNPFQGYFNSSLISRDGIVDDPSCFCKNNLVHRTYYHYNSRDNTTSTSQSRWDYQYVRPPYPSSVTTTYHTLYWTDVTVKSYFYYGDPWAEE